jgi:hypothetical protein
MLTASMNGSGSPEPGTVRACQNEAAELLSTGRFIEYHATMPGWSQERSRRARLLVLARANWVHGRRPALDDVPLVVDSTVHLPGQEDRAKALVERNVRVAMQQDLRRAFDEVEPHITDFLAKAYASPPFDFREMRDFLALGRYEPSMWQGQLERAAAMGKTRLPDVLSPPADR